MSSRVLFGSGAIGETIKRIQHTLTQNGFDTEGSDGWYGENTAHAVRQFQEAKSLAATGTIDDSTWNLLMACSVPPVRERSLQVTASFEGHGFGLAVGNFDGALLTWGIIGFTMASGQVQEIVESMEKDRPDIIRDAFQAFAENLLQVMRAPADLQKSWANEHTLPSGALMRPWREMFATFGSYPEVQAEQMKRVSNDYLDPAIATAKKLNFTSELGLALCFDIHVQNGGIKRSAWQQIQQQSGPNIKEPDLRIIVANAVADSARKAYREDVRKRKLTLATGQGSVHGHAYDLQAWGLSGSFTAEELTGASAQAA